MSDYREQIGSLIRAQLQDNDELDPTDVVTHWTVLVGLHGTDDDGEPAGTARVIRSEPGMPIHTELGLIEERRMYVQAVITDAHRRAYGDGDDR